MFFTIYNYLRININPKLIYYILSTLFVGGIFSQTKSGSFLLNPFNRAMIIGDNQINNIYELRKFLKKERITSLLIGPGAGTNKKIKEITKLILKKVKHVVLDADALTCFKNDLKTLYVLLDKDKIITPHMSEFHKIMSNIEKVKAAGKLIKSNIVLKGPNTIILSYDKKIVINYHSSPELAVIGSGDVLSGLLVSLIGEKKMKPFLAGCAATWLHGDIAKKYGIGLISEDIVRGIPEALKRLKDGKFTK